MQNFLNYIVFRIPDHPFMLITNNKMAQKTTRKYSDWLVNLSRNESKHIGSFVTSRQRFIPQPCISQ
jgi:hypothetical protein